MAFLKAYCLGLIRWAVAFFKRVSRRTSKVFEIVFSSEIGRWLVGIRLFFPDLDIITTFKVFQGMGKCSKRRQQIYILVRCRIVRLEIFRRAVFVILSGPGAFLLGKFPLYNNNPNTKIAYIQWLLKYKYPNIRGCFFLY